MAKTYPPYHFYDQFHVNEDVSLTMASITNCVYRYTNSTNTKEYLGSFTIEQWHLVKSYYYLECLITGELFY